MANGLLVCFQSAQGVREGCSTSTGAACTCCSCICLPALTESAWLGAHLPKLPHAAVVCCCPVGCVPLWRAHAAAGSRNGSGPQAMPAPRPLQDGRSGGLVGGWRREGDPGDWVCPACGNTNYGLRTQCNMRKCAEPRPSRPSPFMPPLPLHLLTLPPAPARCPSPLPAPAARSHPPLPTAAATATATPPPSPRATATTTDAFTRWCQAHTFLEQYASLDCTVWNCGTVGCACGVAQGKGKV